MLMDIIDILTRLPGEFWSVLIEMAPYLLLGFLVAGLLSVYISPATVERHLGGRGLWPILKAAAVGVPIPLCSCGVIPVSASLRKHGASRGATTAFLISTPQTGVDSIAVTYSLLGGVFAIFRPVVALIAGILGGVLVDLADKRQAVIHAEVPPTCKDACCAGPVQGGKIGRILTYAFSTLPRDLARSLLLGLAIAALITAVVPPNYFQTAWGGVLGTGIIGIVVMMAMGVPLYVCATASVPMAWALIDKGVSPGAAFAFLVTGPATNAATIAMIWKVMGRRTALIYLGTMAVTAVAGGIVLDYLLPAGSLILPQMSGHAGHHMEPSNLELIFKNACGVALVAMLVVAFWRGLPKKEVQSAGGVDAKGFDVARVTITGMTCSHCAAAVERAVRQSAAIEDVKIDLATGTATITGEGLNADTLRQAITGLGYTVKEMTIEGPDRTA